MERIIKAVTVSMRTRRRWFDEGAAALREFAELRPGQVEFPEGTWYCCPCCCWAFGPDALDARELTVEHVPGGLGRRQGDLADLPGLQQQGWRPARCLCREPGELRPVLERRGDLEAVPGPDGRDGIPLRGDAWFDNRTMMLQGIDKKNHSVVRDQHIAKLNEFVDSGMVSPPVTFKIQTGKFSDA